MQLKLMQSFGPALPVKSDAGSVTYYQLPSSPCIFGVSVPNHEYTNKLVNWLDYRMCQNMRFGYHAFTKLIRCALNEKWSIADIEFEKPLSNALQAEFDFVIASTKVPNIGQGRRQWLTQEFQRLIKIAEKEERVKIRQVKVISSGTITVRRNGYVYIPSKDFLSDVDLLVQSAA